MKKKWILGALAALLGLGLLARGWWGSQPPKEIAEPYGQFLEAFSSGTCEDTEAFLHYENPEYRQMNLENFHNLQAYRIEKWKRLNDKLWVAKTSIQLVGDTDWTLCYHFVGALDGRIQVMPGPHNVPAQLAEGRDLRGYIPPNAMLEEAAFSK